MLKFFHLKHFYLMVGMNKEAIRIKCSLCIYDTVLCEKYVIHAVNSRHAGHFLMLLSSSTDFLKNMYLKERDFQEHHSECQSVWTKVLT